ncbi:g7411 [Coccomyxa elongata]
MEEDDDHVVYGAAEDVPWISKDLLNYHPRKDRGRTYAKLHEHLSKRREEESVNFANDQRDTVDQQISVQPQSAIRAMSAAATLGQNVIANLESRFKDTADGADALDICTAAHAHPFLEEHDDAATAEAQNPLAALGLQPHASHMQQRGREDSVLLEGETSSGYQGVFAHRNKRQSESASRHMMEQTGGHRSKRKTPLSKQKAKFAIREAPVMVGTANKTPIPDILKTLKGLDADSRHASSGDMIVEEDEGCSYDKNAFDFQSPRAEQARAAASEAEVASPEQPQPHRRVGMTIVGGSTSLQTPVSATHPVEVDMHETAVGPSTTAGKSAQQNFLASVLQGAPVPRRQVQTSRGVNGTLAARLQQEESYMTHADGEYAFQVEILEMEREDNIIKCRCKRLGEEPGTIFAYIKSSMLVNTDVGCRMTICSPWKMMQLQSCTVPLYFVYHATNT